MAFTFQDYTKNKPINPYSDLISNLLASYQEGIKTKYSGPNAQEDLLKKQQYNKMYIPDIESQIGLRGAQTGESGARTGLLGEQTNAARMNNQFLPQQLKTQLQQAAIQQQILSQVARGMGGNQSSMQQPAMIQQPEYNAGNGQPPFMQQQPEMTEPMPSPNNPPSMGSSGLTYPQAAMAMKMLGLGTPKIENINGKYTAFTPFGNIEVAQGQTKLQEALSKKDAEIINNLETTSLSADNKLNTLNEVGSLISSPIFEEMRQNPILGKHELAWFSKFGSPEQQNLVGKFLADTGEIIKDSARDFKGAFRTGEQGLLNSMKPTPSDSLDVMKGKAEALTFLVQALGDRSRMESELMRERGMSAIQARKEVNNVFNPEGIKQEIRDKLSTKRKPTREGLLAEIERRKAEGKL